MPALRISDGIELIQQHVPFKNEYELQEILAEYGGILVDREDLSVITISREFALDNGFIDIFLVDREGLPIIVEVKLSRNGESRREVIGQLIDYLSALERLSVDEINKRSEGNLEKAFRKIAGYEDEEDRERIYKLIKSNFASYLRSGQIRGIIVLDNAPDELIREFSYMNEHSDSDMRLMVVERYQLNKSEYFYHSRYLVAGNAASDTRRHRKRFQQIIEKFTKIIEKEGFSTHTTGKENVRVYYNLWPRSVHYEFCDWKESISIELQVLNKEHPKIIEFLPRLRDYFSSKIQGIERVELIDNHNGWSRLQLFFNDNVDSYNIAYAMNIMCKSEKDISTLLEEEKADR